MFALVDVNNMYVSCERVFRPQLVGRSVVVLSSNDGACIARSNEAKALGVTMAQPWFQVRHLERSAGLVAVSANFELYSDMSARMMAVAGRFAPRQEVYSIDECFLDFAGVPGDHASICRALRAAVLRETGLPTSVGLGPTKTLAKLANHVAKTADRAVADAADAEDTAAPAQLYPKALAQVCNLGTMSAADREAIFSKTSVGQVWGIGRRIGAQLVEGGVHTVLDLLHCDIAALRKRFGVVLEKTVLELRGTPCLEMSDIEAPASDKQQILVSRSFGKAVTDEPGIVEAVSEFASRACEKLRLQAGAAGTVTVFFTTSPFRPNDRQHSVNVSIPLGRATADTRTIVAAAAEGVRKSFRRGFNYAKAGVVLVDLQRAADVDRQGELDLFPSDHEEPKAPVRDRAALMETMDALNRRFGRGAVQIGSASVASGIGPQDQERSWSTRQERRSPRYTTRWDEMPTVRA